MDNRRPERTVIAELNMLRSRVAELERYVHLVGDRAVPTPAAPLTGAVWRHEIFPARITVDNLDGTYQAVRLAATAANAFADDPDDTAAVTVGCIAERTGYSGALAVGDVVLVRFDGLKYGSEPIYHVW